MPCGGERRGLRRSGISSENDPYAIETGELHSLAPSAAVYVELRCSGWRVSCVLELFSWSSAEEFADECQELIDSESGRDETFVGVPSFSVWVVSGEGNGEP